MDEIITEILARLRAGETVGERELVKLMHAAAKRAGTDKRAFAKRRLLPYYQRVKQEDPKRWRSWDIDSDLERRLVAVLRMKPRRSASGVATITVITKPWPCSGACIFCPNDIGAPKSYLTDEPACARAAQNAYDPYLQVATRLTALRQMGHATDKIELIILGGTWSDYPEAYQIWFVTELFRALNDRADVAEPSPQVAQRREHLAACGALPGAASPAQLAARARAAQAVAAGEATYNQAIRDLRAADTALPRREAIEHATLADLEAAQRTNEQARHRVVGLVIETRPDTITPARLALIRRLGATKIQMGVQSLDQRVLDLNGRHTSVATTERALALTRLFGFKTHTHFMVNLMGATPQSDRRDYRRFMTETPFQPDEVKLYPCALIGATPLETAYAQGAWRPYTEDELVGVLVDDIRATPAFCRVSRMIRDFSTDDILAGNKKPNLRQLVEARLQAESQAGAPPVREIRFREVGTQAVDIATLALEVVAYETGATSERFLQWVTPQGRIAGFLRLSLPDPHALEALARDLAEHNLPCPIQPGEAIIREVHIYGTALAVGAEGPAAQHHGLGRRLIERACDIARAAGYTRVNVISAVGTREYYRRLGFTDHGLYQQRELQDGKE